MRDIPMFATELGVASLTLKEIPYTKKAYVTIHDASAPSEFAEECASFCKAAGAEAVFATGHAVLEKYSFHTSIWEMCCPRSVLPDTEAILVPVRDQTLDNWRELYNQRMCDVPNASYMTRWDGEELLRKENGYFVYLGDTLLGLGIAGGDTIDAVISLNPGCGKVVLTALVRALSVERIRLTVASENRRAVRLYESLGFRKTAELSAWYKIFDNVK